MKLRHLLSRSLFSITTILFFSFFLFQHRAHATQPTGLIKNIAFYGSGADETMFVTIASGTSACPYNGSYVMRMSQARRGMTAALLAAFQAQNTVTIVGTGSCDTLWPNHEGLQYATISK